MSCQVQINTINKLKEKKIIDDFSAEGRNRILDLYEFNTLNDKYTQLAKIKYPNLVLGDGQMLFSVEEVENKDISRSTYWRDATYKTFWAIPSVDAFNKLQVEFDKAAESETKLKENPKIDKDGQYLLFGLDTTDQEKMEFEVTTLNVMNQFLENIGIEQRLVPNFLDSKGNIVDSALAAANFINGTIDIIDDVNKRPAAWNKLPEEAAHWWYRLLKEDSGLKKMLWESHKTALKANELYKTSYGKLVNKPEDLTEEAIGQLIAEAIKKVERNEGAPEDYSFLKAFVKWLNELIASFRSVVEDPFEIAAMKILTSDMSDLMTFDEYRKLNDIVYFDTVLDNQSVAPMDYTVIEDIGQPVNHAGYFAFVFFNKPEGQDSSPDFKSQEELDAWVYENVKEYAPRQKQKAQEVLDTEEFFNYLVNKKFKKRSRFLKKTLQKEYSISNSARLRDLNKFDPRLNIEITKKLNDQEKKILEGTNNYTLITPTLKVLPLILQKYKKNPIVLSEKLKVDGMKKQESEIIEAVKELIRIENPELKTISADILVSEVFYYLDANYTLGFANENKYLDYRVSATFNKTSGTDGPIKHNKISLRFNNTYHTKRGHFDYAPSAWANLTYFYDNNSDTKNAVLLHEIQNDNIEHLRNFLVEDNQIDIEYEYFLDNVTNSLKQNIDSILNNNFSINKAHSPRANQHHVSYFVLNNYGEDRAYQRFKEVMQEGVDLYESANTEDPVRYVLNKIDDLYKKRMQIQSVIRNGGIKSLLNEQQIKEIKEIIDSINNAETPFERSLQDKKQMFRDLTNSYINIINENFKKKYNTTNEIIQSYGQRLEIKAKPRTNYTKLNDNINFLFSGNDKVVLDFVNQEILDQKKYLVGAFKERNAYQFKKKLSKLTRDQYKQLEENIKFNQDLYDKSIEIQSQKDLEEAKKQGATVSESDINWGLTLPNDSNNYYYYGMPLKATDKQDAIKEVLKMTNKQMLELQQIAVDELKLKAEKKKIELEEQYGSAIAKAEEILPMEMGYFTPLVHYAIQKHIKNYGKDFPMYFSGYDTTLRTQGNPRTALIYAGKDEVKFTKDEADMIKYNVARKIGAYDKGPNPSKSEIEEAIKNLSQYKKESEYNLNQVVQETMRLSNDQPIETGAIYNALSQIPGIKLVWVPSVSGLRDGAGAYKVDLTNYNFDQPVLYGLDTTVQKESKSEVIEEYGIPLVDINIETLQDTRSKVVGEALAKRLSLGLKVGFQNISAEQAARITRNSPTPYNGQPAFYHAGVVYIVGDNININTVLHEFSHPVINGIRMKNRKLFDNLYNSLINTVEGKQILDNTLLKYPELANNEDMLKSEVLTYGLQLSAVNKLTEKIQTEGFESVINKIMAAIKQFIRGIFGNKKGISDIDVNTSLDELGKMLLEDEIDLSEYDITEDDLIQYGKFVTERANELTKSINKEGLEKVINEWYASNQAIYNRAKNFKTDKAVREMLRKSIFGEKEGSTNLLPEALSSLRSFQTITDFSKFSTDELMEKVLDSEDKRIKQLDRMARALINSIDKIDIISENMLTDLGKIYREKNISARNTIALVNFYKQNAYAWKETIDQFNDIIRESKFDLDKDNLFYKVLNKINSNLDEIEVVVSQIYKKNNIQFYVELTGPMNQFVEEEFKKNLGIAFKNAYSSTAEREAAVNSFYDKVISQEDVTDDLEELYKKGVPADVLTRFLNLYQQMVATPEKIQNALTGHAKDVSWFNRFLESYTSSNDPIVGSLAIFIQNQRTEIANEFMDQSGSFLKSLEKLLPQVNFSKLSVTQIQDMVTYEDTILYWDKNTGKPIEKKIRTFLHEFGNGYRYAEDILEYNLAEARASKDQEKIVAARDELKEFRKDYMWQEYVPEYYESDKIYDEIIEGYDAATSKKIAMEAYADRANALDDYNNLVNEHDDELSRFEHYEAIKAAWDKYKQLTKLTYEDGTAKVDDPKKGIFDLSKAKLLQKISQAKAKFYEFTPMPKSLETAYNEFVNNLATDGIKRDTKEFDIKFKRWKKQNLNMRYDPKYLERRTQLIDKIQQLQSKMDIDFDVAGTYRQISDLIYTYRDELGQPIAPELGVDKIKMIRDLEQGIIDFRERLDKNSGLTQDERAYLNTLTAIVKRGGELTDPQKTAMMNLLQRQSKTGLTIAEAAELQNAFSELGDLQEKVPTDYYMDALNYNLSRLNKKEVTAEEFENYINSDEFQDLLEEDETLAEWFEMNHIVKKKKSQDNKVEIVYELSMANRVTVPVNKDYILKTKIMDNDTGEEITLEGVPNARHSRYQVKNEYRTIPFGESYNDYVGIYVDNKGNFLPRLFDPKSKYSAKNSRFMNQRYFDLKRANNAEFKLLEEMKKFHLSVQKGQSNYSKLYLDMPRFAIKAGDFYQAMQRGKIGERFKNFKEWGKQLVGRSVNDFERGYNYDAKNNLVNTDLKGNQITYVPVEGIFNLDLENTDADIITGLFRYGMSVKTQGKLLESLPIVESIVDTLEDPANQPKNMDAYSKGIFNVRNLYQNPTLKGAQNNRLGQVKSLIEREYLGQQTASFEASNPKLAKWLDLIQGLSTRASLAVNIPSDLKNQFSGYIQSMIEAIGGEFITAKDYAQAVPWSTQAMLTWASKDAYAIGPGSLSGQMIQRFDPTFTSEDKFGNSVTKSIAKDLANGSWMYAHRKFGEMDVAVKLFGSFMHGQKVNQLVGGKQVAIRYVHAFELDKEGLMQLKAGVDVAWDTKPVYHTYTKGESLKQIADKYNVTVEELKKRNNIESEIQFEDGQEITIAKSEKFKAFKNKLQGTSRRLFGAYDRFGQAEGNKFIAYRMFFFMRKWFTPMLTNRWGMDFKTASISQGGERYDWALGRYTKGYYISAFQTLVRLIKSKGAEMSYMTDQEKADFKRFAAEGMFIIVSALLASMLLGFDPDDDDKWKKIKARSGAINQDNYNTYGFLANHMLLLILGVQSETSAFVPLPKIFGVNLGADDYVKMLTSTSTSWYNTVVLYVQIMGDLLNFVTFQDANRYEKDQGPYWWQQKGALKLWKRLFGVVGFTGGTGDPETVLKNFQASSSRIGG